MRLVHDEFRDTRINRDDLLFGVHVADRIDLCLQGVDVSSFWKGIVVLGFACHLLLFLVVCNDGKILGEMLFVDTVPQITSGRGLQVLNHVTVQRALRTDCAA